jgi:hypothetical protein
MCNTFSYGFERLGEPALDDAEDDDDEDTIDPDADDDLEATIVY